MAYSFKIFTLSSNRLSCMSTILTMNFTKGVNQEAKAGAERGPQQNVPIRCLHNTHCNQLLGSDRS